ncbi:chromatin assembly factor 1 subunit B [Bicyclus anynana]|uniref:Chromatin assembly factor 1 subunit B n=1 Tax=Bicyclus anynana TaxID=110368 RepID=A0ABM3LK27_BICAN|nr:chromatin assembly factor 1 subunit B [Bicyclus anynana]
MKLAIPEISWHNRDPVLSVDFQPKSEQNDPLRLATGGTDSHVLIWYITTKDSGSVNLEMAADLTKHQKAVNVVRWSPDGQYLASGDDESIIFVWKQKTEEAPPVLEGEEQYRETWVIHKILRGHMEDILDLSWSPSSTQLASGSVDNKLLLWDVARARHIALLTDHKGFVQGVTWDPKGQLIATASTDRVFRTFDVSTKKVVSRSSKAVLPLPPAHALHGARVRLYHDDTLQTYYRRLHFSPDGLLVAVPAGSIEAEAGKPELKPINAVYIYTRHSLKVPACVLPCGAPALVVRWSPCRYAVRRNGPPAAFPVPHRMVLAVGTKRSLLVYDTQQRTPLALVTNMHYTRLTDLTWSPDGLILVASSTDGFCSVVSFADGELGEVLTDEDEIMDQPIDKETTDDAKETKTKTESKQTARNISKIDSFIKFKTPSSAKSPKKAKIENTEQKTPVKYDVLVETAMPSWSDNSSNDIIKPKETVPMDIDKDEIMVIEDSEDIKLVYDDSVTQSNTQSPKETKKDNISPEESKSDIESKTKTNESSLKENKVEDLKSISKENKSDNDSKEIKGKPNSKDLKSEDELKVTKKIDKKESNDSPKRKLSPQQCVTPSSKQSESNFLKQAKVTDMKTVTVQSAPSPKAPRRVSFVTLSSPKNSKKK